MNNVVSLILEQFGFIRVESDILKIYQKDNVLVDVHEQLVDISVFRPGEPLPYGAADIHRFMLPRQEKELLQFIIQL